MAELTLTERIALTKAVLQSLKDDDYEGAVESVFALYPDITRDEAVDKVEEIARVNPQRTLSRHERLQALADSGVDTWEEYRGER